MTFLFTLVPQRVSAPRARRSMRISPSSPIAACAIAVLWSLLAAAVPVGGLTGAAEPAGKLPPNPPEFKGVIGRTIKDSKPAFPEPVRAPKDAPNVVIIMTDDTGFGHASTLGGPI